MYALGEWCETPFYTEQEPAALAWTAALTLISENDVTDSLHDSVRKHFEEKEMVALTMAVIAINGWNLMAIGIGKETEHPYTAPARIVNGELNYEKALDEN